MALEHPVVREALAQLAEQGVPTVTLISDLSNSRRVAYVGLDNRAAGRTTAYLIARFIGPLAHSRKGHEAMCTTGLFPYAVSGEDRTLPLAKRSTN